MKRILIPVDYSNVSINALHYAANFAEGQEVELLIFHVYSGLLDMHEPLLTTIGESKQELVESSLKEFVEKNLDGSAISGLNLDFMVVQGNPVYEIVREAQNCDMIVMGTRDKYDLFDKFLGTISLGVSKKSHKPLLLIPNNAKFKNYKRILIASDHHIKDHEILHKIRNWNKPYKAFLQFLHIKDSKKDDFEKMSDEIVKDFFESESDVDFSFEIISKRSTDVSDSLLNSAYQSNMDLIIVVPEDQSFLSSLIFSSISKELILKSAIPVLFIHPPEESES